MLCKFVIVQRKLLLIFCLYSYSYTLTNFTHYVSSQVISLQNNFLYEVFCTVIFHRRSFYFFLLLDMFLCFVDNRYACQSMHTKNPHAWVWLRRCMNSCSQKRPQTLIPQCAGTRSRVLILQHVHGELPIINAVLISYYIFSSCELATRETQFNFNYFWAIFGRSMNRKRLLRI